jgi:1-acyl-sn-glycerol-3-phosphate acyltransferase
VYGKEHIPEEDTVCFVSNHQGIADILLISGNLPKVIGFIAKKELKKVPIVNIWMMVTHCIFIDRGNIKQAAEVIDKGAQYIRNGQPMVVFPEGTRSRGPHIGNFKRGSIKLALRSDSLIVPLTVNGTYKIFEEHKRIKPAPVVLVIHPPIDTKHLTAEERKDLPRTLFDIIEGGLHEIPQ